MSQVAEMKSMCTQLYYLLSAAAAPVVNFLKEAREIIITRTTTTLLEESCNTRNAVANFKAIYPFNPDVITDYASRSDPDRPIGNEKVNVSGRNLQERTLSPLLQSNTRFTDSCRLSADKCNKKSTERKATSPLPGPFYKIKRYLACDFK